PCRPARGASLPLAVLVSVCALTSGFEHPPLPGQEREGVSLRCSACTTHAKGKRPLSRGFHFRHCFSKNTCPSTVTRPERVMPFCVTQLRVVTITVLPLGFW